jgi:hypothetical protein
MNTCHVCSGKVPSFEDCFEISYVPSTVNYEERSEVIKTMWFHPDCFLSAAGKKYALALGFNIENLCRPSQAPQETFSKPSQGDLFR